MMADENTLIKGDPMKPDDLDLIAQQKWLPTEDAVPDGWRILTGNNHRSLIARLAYRFEIEGGT